MNKQEYKYTITLYKQAHKDIIELIESMPKTWRKYLFVDALKFYTKYRNYEKDIIEMIANKGTSNIKIKENIESESVKQEEQKTEVTFSINDLLKNL